MKAAPTAIATALFIALSSIAHADGDIKKGEKVFRKCKACHAVGEGAKARTGPVLNGIVGAAAARDADFKYSGAMKDAAAAGLTWDAAALSAFLTKPRKFLKGTNMSFSGLRRESEVDNVIAYLATFE